MYVKLNNKRYEVREYVSFWDRFKTLKFVIEPIDYIIMLKRKSLSTYLFCQKVDIVMTNDEDEILKIYSNFPSEKIIFPKRLVKITYILPAGLAKNLKINSKFPVKKSKS